MKMFFVLVLNFLVVLNIYANSNIKKIDIDGVISFEKGEVFLFPAASANNYKVNLDNYKAIIKNNKFHLVINSEIPLMLKVAVKQNGILVFISNDLFFVIGKNVVKFNPDSMGRNGLMINDAMIAFQNLHQQKMQLYQSNKLQFSHYPDSIINVFLQYLAENKENSLKGNEFKRFNNALFELYVHQNNSSYMALWLLADNISLLNLEQFEAIFKKFSPSLKQCFLGKRINKKILEMKSLLSNKRFLDWPLFNTNLVLANKIFDSNIKYYFFDFWHSHCNPCISEFDALINLHNRFKEGGLKIVGISSDPKAYIKNWEKVISEYKLPWENYIDFKNISQKKLNITSYPSSILFDADFKVINVNIRTEELEAFLKANLTAKVAIN